MPIVVVSADNRHGSDAERVSSGIGIGLCAGIDVIGAAATRGVSDARVEITAAVVIRRKQRARAAIEPQVRIRECAPAGSRALQVYNVGRALQQLDTEPVMIPRNLDIARGRAVDRNGACRRGVGGVVVTHGHRGLVEFPV